MKVENVSSEKSIQITDISTALSRPTSLFQMDGVELKATVYLRFVEHLIFSALLDYVIIWNLNGPHGETGNVAAAERRL